jgi:hypothetical protein
MMPFGWLCLRGSSTRPSGGVKIVQRERGSGYQPFTTTATTARVDVSSGFFRLGLQVDFISWLKRNARSCRLWSPLG